MDSTELEIFFIINLANLKDVEQPRIAASMRISGSYAVK